MDSGVLVILGVACLILSAIIVGASEDAEGENLRLNRISRRIFFCLSVLTLSFVYYIEHTDKTTVTYLGYHSLQKNPSGNSDHKAKACITGWCFWVGNEKSNWKGVHIYEVKTKPYWFINIHSNIRGFKNGFFLKKERDIFLDDFINERNEN